MPGIISESTREQIRAASDIVDVIGSYFPLKRAGANFLALCPFHKEKTPSFNINPQRQIYRCFGCHKAGDVFKFVQDYENLSYPEAVRRLADRAGILLQVDDQPGAAEGRQTKTLLLEIHEQITKRWQTCLANEAAGQVARDYLDRRGVSVEAREQFRLGFAPDAWDDTVNWAKGRDVAPDLVEQAGLVVRKENSGSRYDRFRGRLMFPITDEQGRVIGFSGRLLDENAKAAKYVNSPETLIFHKSKVFFGLHKARRALLEAESAIVCEGQVDLIACHMQDIRNVVAPQGTAFTPDHARILKRYVSEVVLCFDSDAAGQSAAVRAFDSLLTAGLAVRVALLPSPHDPDTFLKEEGPDAFRQLIDGAPGFFDFLLNRLCARNDSQSDRGRQAIVQEMSEAVGKTQNQVLIDTYGQKTAQRLGVTADAVRAEFRKRKVRRPREAEARAEEEIPAPAAQERPSQSEFWLLKILFSNDELVDWIAEHLDLEWLVHGGVRTLVERRWRAREEGSWREVAPFLDNLGDEALQQLLTGAVLDGRALPDPERMLKGDRAHKGILERLRDDHLDRCILRLRQEAGQEGLTDEDKIRIAETLTQLRRKKQSPLIRDGVEG